MSLTLFNLQKDVKSSRESDQISDFYPVVDRECMVKAQFTGNQSKYYAINVCLMILS